MYKLTQLLILSLFAAIILPSCSSEIIIPDTSKISVIVAGGKFKINPMYVRYDSIPAYYVDGVEQKLPNFKLTDHELISSAIGVSKTGKIHFIASGKANNALLSEGFSQYWIDGVEQSLPAALQVVNYYADGIVKDEKFHLIGHSYDDYKYWVEGVAQQFSKDVDYLYDISQSADGNQVIIGGQILTPSKDGPAMVAINGDVTEVADFYTVRKAEIFNGIPFAIGIARGQTSSGVRYKVGDVAHDLPNSDLNYGEFGLCVSNGKVYITAQLYKWGGSSVPRYWIDGVEQALPAGATQLRDVTVFEDKVYLLGSISGKFTYWVDGVPHSLPDGVKYADKIVVIRK